MEKKQHKEVLFQGTVTGCDTSQAGEKYVKHPSSTEKVFLNCVFSKASFSGSLDCVSPLVTVYPGELQRRESKEAT